MRVIVTRPAREAAQWVDALRARGLAALALPLIEVGDAPDPAAVAAAWARLDRLAAVMFVSPNAVDRFFAHRPADAAWVQARAWAPGPGTREALVEAGVPQRLLDAPAADAAQFDSEALWQQVSGQVRAGDRVLLVRGAGAGGQAQGREWLAAQLQAAGTTVETVVAYRRGSPEWNAAQLAQARQAAADGSVWLFSSSEAIGHLLRLLPAQSWAAAKALATHPRIAQTAREAGFGVVCGSRPELSAVVASIESIR